MGFRHKILGRSSIALFVIQLCSGTWRLGPGTAFLLPIACQIEFCWRDHFMTVITTEDDYLVESNILCETRWPLRFVMTVYVCNLAVAFVHQRLHRARLQTTPVFNMAVGNAAAYSQAARIADWISKQTQNSLPQELVWQRLRDGSHVWVQHTDEVWPQTTKYCLRHAIYYFPHVSSAFHFYFPCSIPSSGEKYTTARLTPAIQKLIINVLTEFSLYMHEFTSVFPCEYSWRWSGDSRSYNNDNSPVLHVLILKLIVDKP